jgi:type II secretory pathway pseudopilin PulG
MVRARMGGERGFTLVGLLVIMLIIGIMTTVVARSWRIAAKADKEQELLWRGRQFRLAIKRYYDSKEVPSHVGLNIYPSELKDLLKDPRSPGVHRYLRKIYIDPMTGKDDWVLVFDDKQHIKGVHSLSDGETLKRDNFDLDDSDFRGKARYSEWIFQYLGTAATTPTTTQTQANPATSPHTGQ